ncbi:MAG: peptide chain release factor 1 [Flavobacteriales bacterium]
MIDKLESIHQRFIEVSDLIIEPDVISDMKRYVQLNKEYKDLQKIEEAYQEYKTLLANIEESKDLLANETDPEMKEMAKAELDEALPRKAELDEEIKWLLVPKDPEDAKNAQVEIRAGTGGDEASIFAGDLFRMYTKYCEGRGWRVSVTDFQEGTSGGYKEVIFEVSGSDVYGVIKYESGVHRVQRVPQTETQGRVHTSAATVIVLPEAEEFDIELKDSDIRVDSYCSSGPGGQSVNTTYSAIRLTHIPTGIVAQCQDQKSKLKNHAKALKTLRTRIYEQELQKKLAEDQAHRKTLVASGDRSAKIRTYNYPQGRVTDHRIGLTLYSLGDIMNGDIQKIIDELTIAENTERLKSGDE